MALSYIHLEDTSPLPTKNKKWFKDNFYLIPNTFKAFMGLDDKFKYRLFKLIVLPNNLDM